MTSNFDISGASSIDASCCNKTTDEAYDDLRDLRTLLTKKTQGVIKLFEKLKDVEIDEEDDDLETADESASLDDYNMMRMETYDQIRKRSRVSPCPTRPAIRASASWRASRMNTLRQRKMDRCRVAVVVVDAGVLSDVGGRVRPRGRPSPA